MKTLFADAAVYSIAPILRKGAALLVLPLCARHLTLDEFGIIAFIVAMMTVAAAFASCSFSSGVTRFFHEHNGKERGDMAASALAASSATSAATFLIAVYSIPPITRLALNQNADSIVYVGLAGVFATGIGQLFTNLLRLARRKWIFAALSTVTGATTVGTILYCVVVEKMGALGMMLGTTTGAVCECVLFGIASIDLWRGVPRWLFVKRLASFSLPLILVQLAAILKNQTDKWFLVSFCSLKDLGLYAIAEKFAMLVNLLGVTVFKLAWSPYIYSFAKNHEKQKSVLAEVSSVYFFLLLCFVLALSLMSPIVLHLFFPPPMLEAWKLVLPLCLIQVFYGMGFVWCIGIHMAFKTRLMPIAVILGLLVNVLLDAILVPALGPFGAAWGSAVASSILALTYLRIAQHYYPTGYRLPREGIALVGFIVLANANHFSARLATPGPALILTAAAMATMIALGYTALLTEESRIGVRLQCRRILRLLPWTPDADT